MKGHPWLAATYDFVTRRIEQHTLAPLRQRLLSTLAGRVLEIGAGTGASFPHYPASAMVIAAEPDPYMLRRAKERGREIGPRIAVIQCVAEALPFTPGVFDAAVATIVLCTVEDQALSLAEAKRVLKPGGTLRFIEHVRAGGLAGRVQDALTPLWRRLAAGCHLNRRTVDDIEAAGFRVERLEQHALVGGVPLVSGVAAPA